MEEEKFLEMFKLVKENSVVLEFMKNNVVMKEDFDKLVVKVDNFEQRFGGLENSLEQFQLKTEGSFALLEKELTDLKIKLDELSKRTIEDADVTAQDVTELEARVRVLESKVNQMQTA